MIQRSKGYAWRKSLSISDIKEEIDAVKSVRDDVIVMVDNCYGEFLEALEPTDVCVYASRGRHTRYSRDWSSDLCSSDLSGAGRLGSRSSHPRCRRRKARVRRCPGLASPSHTRSARRNTRVSPTSSACRGKPRASSGAA